MISKKQYNRHILYQPKNLPEALVFILSRELPKLSDVCYYPNIAQYKRILLQFVNPIPFKHKFKLLKNDTTILLLRVIPILVSIDDIRRAYRILTLHIYGNLMRKHIKYCDSKRMHIAISKLSKSHFFKKMGIETTLLYTADRMMQRFGHKLDDDQLVRMYLYLRTAIAQMVKSLARRYYGLTREDLEIKPTIAKQLAPVIAKEISLDHYHEECIQITERMLKISAIDIRTIVDYIRSNSLLLTDIIKLVLDDVERKTQICSPIWMLSRIKKVQDRNSTLYRSLKSNLPKYSDKQYVALVRYLLCRIKHLVC